VFRDAIRDVHRLGLGEQAVPPAVDVHHPQCAAADVCDAPAGGIRPRVGHRGHGRHVPQRLSVGRHRPQLTVEREGHGAYGCVRRVPDDPGPALPGPFAPRQLLRRHLAVQPAQRYRIGQQPLAAVRFEQPQAGDGIVSCLAANEQHALTVGRDSESAGRPVGEPACTGELAWEVRWVRWVCRVHGRPCAGFAEHGKRISGPKPV
jgi:hypothetical protein